MLNLKLYPRLAYTDAQLNHVGLHSLTFEDCKRYPSVENQLLADYGEVLTAPCVAGCLPR